jgi:nanoRNase/pAp phosphatase (c-di-AMP/oligoRNAs hydrolase)
MESARIYNDTLVFNLGRVDHPEIVAEMADFLLRAEGVELVLGMGESADEGILSLRTSNLSVNAGTLIQQVTAGFGSAGGHGLVAGGQLKKLPEDSAGKAALETELVHRLLTALGRESVLPRPLLPV